ncbi:hypothetical protein, partial [Enterococcus faecalis]|uniref:hypothetical protein n=1 Tax=Enterococcus faecalis TaxID=1351 RepID=UPI001D173090
MTFTTEDFQQFLRSNQQTLIFQEESRTKSLIKIMIDPKSTRFFSVFLNPFLQDGESLSFRLNESIGDVIGIYDSVTDTFFSQAEYLIEWHLKGVDITGFKDLHEVIQQLERELAEQTLAEINQHYQYYYTLETDYLSNLSDWVITRLKKDTRKKILDEKTTFLLNHSFVQYECSDSEILELLTDKQGTRARLVKEYLLKNDKKVSQTLQELQFQQQYAKELAENKHFQKEKEIIQAVQNKGMKTITVTYQISDKELTFKMRNVIDSSRDYFSSYDITNKKERDAYDTLTREAIDLQKIKQISYGRNVLYAE